jgi:formate hydrogenlyase transcriptional activator
MVNERRYCADLFYRLNVFPVSTPSLRDRSEDIALLIRHFVQRFGALADRVIDSIPEEAMELLRSYTWPGNIRELRNLAGRSMLLSAGRVVEVQIPELRRISAASSSAPGRTLAELERSSIAEALRRTNRVIGGNGGAAAQLGVPRTTLISRMREHGISRESLTGTCQIIQPGFPVGNAESHAAQRAMSAFA